MYQKVKNLEKAQEELTSLILLKNRILEKSILQVRLDMKKSKSNQGKSLDNLKEVISDSNLELLEKTIGLETLMCNNDLKYMDNFLKFDNLERKIEITDGSIKEINTLISSLMDALK